MSGKHIELIPIDKIRVVNPRHRNQQTFGGIVSNIGLVGLKKPITVFRREKDQDGTEYDLVCGQGRMEAIALLGGTSIPAVITNAPLRERYLMSLVENIARKRPPQSDLLCEVRRLKKAGLKNVAIAERLGLGKTYLDGIVRLLRKGEDRMVEQVVAGTVPLNVAITIATAGDDEVQRALSAAYDTGELRGAKLLTVQKILARRAATINKSPQDKEPVRRMSSKDLVLEYEIQTGRQRALLKRATLVRERLNLLVAAFRKLLADDQFVRLLQAEKLDSIPEPLAMRAMHRGSYAGH